MTKRKAKAPKEPKAPKTPKEPKGPKEPVTPAGTAAAKAEPDLPAKGPIRVRATQTGLYDNKRRREGDVFTIAGPEAFSAKWMEQVSKNTPEKITTGQQVVDGAHSDKMNATGGANPLGAD